MKAHRHTCSWRSPSRWPPRLARAQQPAVDVRTHLSEPARHAWDAAKQLANAADYKGALVEFHARRALTQPARALQPGRHRRSRPTHYARAIDAWDRELREGAGQLSPAESQELKNAIAIVQQFVTTIEVSANEEGATLFVDDFAVGKTPFVGPVRIDVGKHVLKLSKMASSTASSRSTSRRGKLPVESFASSR